VSLAKELIALFKKHLKRDEGEGVSIIIPFRKPSCDDRRLENLKWLLEYWKEHLPKAEIIIGRDEKGSPFSKSVAVNDGYIQSSGDVLVIVDADGYIDVDSVLHCVHEIRRERDLGRRLWFVPYRRFCRMTRQASDLVINSNPKHPHKFSFPLEIEHLQKGAEPNVGHWYGAMIQILPREAFEIVGGWDERFRGWGGEDHAATRATDTLYGSHKTLPDQVLHLWHPQIGPSDTDGWVHWKERKWEGQSDPAANDRLSWRYYHANGSWRVMRKLVDEWLTGSEHRQRRHKHHHHRKSC
jgi:hypothetical protein